MRLWQVLFFDALFVAVYIVALGLPLGATVIGGPLLFQEALRQLSPGLPPVAVVAIAVSAVAVALWTLLPAWVLLVLFVARFIAGPLTAGTHAMSSPAAVRWSAHFILHKVAANPAIKWFLFGGYVSRFLLLRALGAKVALRAQASSDAWVMDCALVTLGEDTLLGTSVLLLPHSIEGKHLTLGPIELGDGVRVLEGVLLGPNTRIGARSVVGAEARVAYGVEVGAGVRLGAGVLLLGPGIVVGDGSVIGRGASLGRNVVLGARARIRKGTHVPAGTRVAAGKAYPPKPAASSAAAS